MSLFQHPHRVRGIVQTEKGAFTVVRGLVEMPDDVGEALGWRPVDSNDRSNAADRRMMLGGESMCEPQENRTP